MTSTTPTPPDTRATADKLRSVADLLEAHPELPTPCVFAYGRSGNVDVTWQLMNTAEVKDNQLEAMQAIVRAIGGQWQKNPWDDRYDLEQKRDGLTLQVFAHRDQVCERVVTGTEEVTVPAVEARPERTEVREVVEWRCSPVLAERVEVSA